MRRCGVLFLAVVGLLVSGSGISADAAPIGCGGHVPDGTTVKLTQNILNCTSDPAIVFDGDNSVLDLNGHTVQGSGTGVGIQADGRDHDTVTNGIITNFATAVQFANGTADHAIALILRPLTTGIDLNATSHALASGNTISGGVNGVLDHGNTTSDVIRANIIAVSSDGILPSGTPLNLLISHNQISGGFVGIGDLASGLSYVRMTRNTIRGAQNGINVSGGPNQQVDGNKLLRNTQDGLVINDPATQVSVFNNTATGNGHDGIENASGQAGIHVGYNVTNGNGNYGIEGTPITDDAGGNRAKLNGASTGVAFQCIGVVCR